MQSAAVSKPSREYTVQLSGFPFLLALGASLIAAAPSTAQVTPAGQTTATRWNPFLGCWSTSSAGMIGPMVCVVPTDSADQVEFLTVSGDSVVSRSKVDASGVEKLYSRKGCVGIERGRWSADGYRLLMHADYACDKGVDRKSDALIDFTRSDAFSYIETDLKSYRKPSRVVNFIVQLDTTLFPAEVRRRLPEYRPLSFESAELERETVLSTPAVVEATAELDRALVATWLAERGESGMLALAPLSVFTPQEIKWRQQDALRGLRRQQGIPTLLSVAWPYVDQGGPYGGTWGVNYGFAWPTNYLVTPAMVGFGVPWVDYPGGFRWGGWPR